MESLPVSITLVILFLTVFLVFVTAIKYAIEDEFRRTRAQMTAFFVYIIATLTISFLQFTSVTLPFTIPAFVLGAFGGYVIGVRTEQQKLRMQGLQQYLQHFSHIHKQDFESLTWWSIVNFYSIMTGLILINFVGLATVIFHGSMDWAIVACVFGAFLLGTIAPYLIHLWSIKAPQMIKSPTNEA